MSLLDDLINIRNFASNGVVLPRRATLNVVTGATVVDNPTTEQTDITYTAVHDLGGYPMLITDPEPFDMVSWDGTNFINRPDRLVVSGEDPGTTVNAGSRHTHTSTVKNYDAHFMSYLIAGGVVALVPMWPSSLPDGLIATMGYTFTTSMVSPELAYVQLTFKFINVTASPIVLPSESGYGALLLQTGPPVS